MSAAFIVQDLLLLVVQAALVVLPGAGVPAWVARLRGRAWALVLPLSIVVVIVAIDQTPAVADGLTWLALIAIPPLAAAALGWADRGAQPWLAPLALVLLALAWADQDALPGQLATLALAALSCVTLARLLAGVAPLVLLKAGIVLMAMIDAWLVFGGSLEQPNAVLNAAVPAKGLPQLQYVQLPEVSFGYGDLFVAAVFGAVLAVEGRRVLPVALLTLALAVAFDLLFFVTDSLPATVPVAVALIIVELWKRERPAIAGLSDARCG